MMHHSNVDRLLSLWSALNPSVWVAKGTEDDGTWSLAPGAPIDKNTGNEVIVCMMYI